MAKINPVNDDVAEILRERTGNCAKKYMHSSINTAHVFLGLFSFLSTNKGTPKYGKMYQTFKDILNSYEVDGKGFETAFLKIFTKGNPLTIGTFVCSASEEYTALVSQMKIRATNEKRTLDVKDLICELFNDKSYNLYTIFMAMLPDSNLLDDMYDKIVKAFKNVDVKREIREFEKSKELVNLNKWVIEHPQRLIGCEDELNALQMCLLPKLNKCAILTGPAGVGKSQLVYSFVQAINDGSVPEELKNKIVYELNPGALVSGTRFRGDFEEKLINILEVCKKNPNVLLFVDEIHSLVKTGDSDGAMNAGNMIKPYITKGEVQVIGATTSEEYTKYILCDKAFADRFHEIKLTEPTKEETIKILKGITPDFKEYFNREISDETIERIVDLSSQYSLDRANPRKSINMMDLAFAHNKTFETDPDKITIEDVIESVRLKYGIYISDEKYKECRKELFETLLGQERALNQICGNLKTVERGLCENDRPKFSMLFAGSTGVGKTEACKIIAKKYFGSENNLIKLNMGEYSSEMDSEVILLA